MPKASGRREKSASAFMTISEVADELDVQQHVLRFWETKFSQIKPMKRGGGRRYYRPEDVTLLKRIKQLLHDDGLTIRGVQKLFATHGVKSILDGQEDPVSNLVDAGVNEGSKAGEGAASDPAIQAESSSNDAPIKPEAINKPTDDTNRPSTSSIHSSRRSELENLLGELKLMRSTLQRAVAE